MELRSYVCFKGVFLIGTIRWGGGGWGFVSHPSFSEKSPATRWELLKPLFGETTSREGRYLGDGGLLLGYIGGSDITR